MKNKERGERKSKGESNKYRLHQHARPQDDDVQSKEVMPADKAIDTKTQFFRRYITASYINNENEKEENVGRESHLPKSWDR